MKTLPKTIYVKIERPRSGEPYFVADQRQFVLAEDDPVEVGRYVLQETSRLRKVVEVVHQKERRTT